MKRKIITTLIATLLITSIVGPAASAQTNDVTWSGEVEVDGSPATNGASYTYDIQDHDSVSDFTINLTGNTAREWSNTTGSNLSFGDSLTVDASGSREPSGPASGEPELSITAKNATAVDSKTYNSNNIGGGESVTGYVDSPGGNFTEVGIGIYDVFDGSQPIDVYVDGDLVVDGHSQSSTRSYVWWDIQSRHVPKGDSINVTLVNRGSSSVYYYDDSGGSGLAVGVRGYPDSMTVSASDGTSASFSSLSGGETRTKGFDISETTSSVNIDGSGGGMYDIDLDLQQVVETKDPTVEVNGNTVSHTGVLSDGESVSLSTEESWIQEGTNRVNVSLATPDGSAPAATVGLDYDHRAGHNVSVEYTGETFSERYNVSKEFSSDRADATTTIPFASSSVVSVREIETRTNGGSWVAVDPEDRTFDGSELTVELGAVGGGETVEVRAVGSKVRVENGEISVSDPTVMGEELNSRIVLESVSSSTEIQVNGTAGGGMVHYTHSESWAEPQAHARFRSDGSQALRFPNAGDGDVFRVSTLDMGVTPSNGHADVRVLSASEQPEFEVLESSDADQVTFEFRDTTSTHKYQLYSLDSEISRDTDVAQSPVSLTSPGVPERLKIYDLGSTSGGGGGGAVVGPTASRSFGANAAFLIGAAVAGIVALFFAARRWGSGGISSKAFFGVGVVTIGVVSLQVLAPNILADYLGRAIESAFPLLLLGGVVVLVFWLRSRGDDTSIIIQGESK